MSELREYQIEYYDVANDTKIFYMTTTGKYIAYVESINRK